MLSIARALAMLDSSWRILEAASFRQRSPAVVVEGNPCNSSLISGREKPVSFAKAMSVRRLAASDE
jgi:hypothetical protein